MTPEFVQALIKKICVRRHEKCEDLCGFGDVDRGGLFGGTRQSGSDVG